jgi:tRNA A37 threonylcarbamoyladenosine synthetase subunit TsaC/SUA5/YrdC
VNCPWISVHPRDPQQRLLRTVHAHLADGIACVPSHAGYVLACMAGHKRCVIALRGVAARLRWSEPAVACHDLCQVAQIALVDDRQFSVLKRHAPGPHTFLLDGAARLPRACWPPRAALRVQIPDHPVLRALVACAGEPIACFAAPEPPRLPHESTGALCVRISAVLDAGLQPTLACETFDLRNRRPDRRPSCPRREPPARSQQRRTERGVDHGPDRR